jgi:hypothetical protein
MTTSTNNTANQHVFCIASLATTDNTTQGSCIIDVKYSYQENSRAENNPRLSLLTLGRETSSRRSPVFLRMACPVLSQRHTYQVR